LSLQSDNKSLSNVLARSARKATMTATARLTTP
jgi:hypothetical protein